jgi:exodeoxyribonuclease VII large subunit
MLPEGVGDTDLELSVSEFVALHNHVLEYTMPSIVIIGELSSFRVSKNRWVYFDLKDDSASVKFFGTVYQLNSPLEDGMVLRVQGTPRVHPQFGFSVNVTSIQLAGEGTIRRAFDLLQQKLLTEGLFDPARKRPLPYPPERIGVIASKESAAYADFTKILSDRWSGIDITLANVQVQGEVAPAQIADAIAQFNQLSDPPEVLVITRGGGSMEDLWAFNTELVTRAVAASRIPTLVAIGHEVDTSLAELAADQRASTPSNAAELLVPDKRAVRESLKASKKSLATHLQTVVQQCKSRLAHQAEELNEEVVRYLDYMRRDARTKHQMLELLSPHSIVARGYAIVRTESGRVVRTAEAAAQERSLQIQFADGKIHAEIKSKLKTKES